MLIAPVFTLTILVSAALLFLVQPMFAKLVLPLLGGAPQVWNTCMVFFQAALLTGYAYADLLSRRLRMHHQVPVHLTVMLLPLLVLPIVVRGSGGQPVYSNPIPWLILTLTASVGLPFFAVATSSPLLQRWFAATRDVRAKDPYFLYAAGNIGSLVALLGYPLWLEPTFPVPVQSHIWTAAYSVLIALTAACAVLALKGRPGGSRLAQTDYVVASPQEAAHGSVAAPYREAEPNWSRRIRWLLLAFVPSSMMLGVTTFITTDIPAGPLFWVVPLALYLLSFALVFARRPPIPHRWMVGSLPAAIIVLALLLVSGAREPVWLVLSLNLAVFFLTAMVCHGELAHDRPTVGHLTRFYLLIAIGGVLGGAFNALFCPVVFTSVIEYPLVLVLAAYLCPSRSDQPPRDTRGWRHRRLLALAAVPGILMIVLNYALDALVPAPGEQFAYDFIKMILVFGTPLVLCYLFSGVPTLFALSLAGILLGNHLYQVSRSDVIFAARSYYGVHRVTYNQPQNAYVLFHGATAHGLQKRDPRLRRLPTAYYHPTGPAGQIFGTFSEELADVAVVGLGVGTLAAYARPDQQFTFFEIDTTVVRIGADPALFSFVYDARARGASISVRLGDARDRLAEEPDGRFDLLVIDAFSGDSMPTHLFTREALALYLRKIGHDGLILFHISSDFLQLRRTACDLAADANVACLIQHNEVASAQERAEGKLPSEWVLMTRDRTSLQRLQPFADRWLQLEGRPGRQVWTDQHSNILEVVSWTAR